MAERLIGTAKQDGSSVKIYDTTARNIYIYYLAVKRKHSRICERTKNEDRNYRRG